MTPLPLATLLIAARVVLNVAELTGENVCHKRETYTVTMRVVVKEPVQVKTYTWCLQVPPRCTKFRIEMRDKIKIQTEVRDRVVDVCCSGYAQDRNETVCIPVCSGCLHGVCASPDTCFCEPGYMGDRCDTECRNGLWGPACGRQCRCQNGAHCNHVTGECKCADGWRGALCDVVCPKGTYGNSCINECNCGTGKIGENSTCHHVTGKCNLSDADHVESKKYHPTTELPNTYTTDKPVGTQIHDKADDNSEDTAADKGADSDIDTTLQSTEKSVPQTEDIPLPNTEKHILTIDDIITTLVTSTATSVYTEFSPFASENTSTGRSPNNFHNLSVTGITPLLEHETNGPDSENYTKQIDGSDFRKDSEVSSTITVEDVEQTTEETGTTEPQNIQVPPRGIIIVSDGLLSGRIEEERGEEPRSGVWNLLSSASVAGGVAVALIVMAAATLLVSHHRNKVKASVAKNELESPSRQEQTPGSQICNYKDDAPTPPLRRLFPDSAFQLTSDTPRPDALKLCFSDVSGTLTPNDDLGCSYHSYHNSRAYLELQYDIPPSSISSKSNSLLPGMEPEHLYDEIPCWRSPATTSTDTHTDTSAC